VQELSMAEFRSILPGDLLRERGRAGGRRVWLVISKDTTTIKVMEVGRSRREAFDEFPASDLAKFERVARRDGPWGQGKGEIEGLVTKLQEMKAAELLKLHAEINEQLRARGILRSANNPTGDLAEYLFCKAFSWQQANNSVRGYDATDSKGTRYQIKARRVHRRTKSRELSAIRDLAKGNFDILAGILFDDDYNVIRAALIPRAVIEARSQYSAYTRSNRFMLRDEIWLLDGVKDVTDKIRAVAL
jgi:hypothetical protein